MAEQELRLGIDVGSTTAKLALVDPSGGLVTHRYARHHAAVSSALVSILEDITDQCEGGRLRIALTGSAGMGLSERYGLPFVQEVIAASQVVRTSFPQAGALIDVGGEDAKVILYDRSLRPDMRMNSNCAGGTGAFIDQMATLLNVSLPDLDALAARSTSIHPIASRCGVFAKTDVQNLISREIAREDIAASIFHALAVQTINSLARGFRIRPPVIFSGGPLSFLPALRRAYVDVLELGPGEVILPTTSRLLPALGAALIDDEKAVMTIRDLIRLLQNSPSVSADVRALPPLFTDQAEYHNWRRDKSRTVVDTVNPIAVDKGELFLGIDSGSTTTKLVAVDSAGRLAFKFYRNNDGYPIEAVKDGLERLRLATGNGQAHAQVRRTAVTGYGEDLVRSAFNIDEGLVETLAHYRAAQAFDPQVSFILDIGGQDMKAIFVRDGVINHIEINEACSSGCGSFIETFARSLNLTVSEFAAAGCRSQAPADLGTRCTVFMNSKVKQTLREGTPVEDVSAGLCYSVIKNCLHKVLKIRDPELLGRRVVVQGGTFKNDGVLRAMEKILGREVVRPADPELMGAYGAALYARDTHLQAPDGPSAFVGLNAADSVLEYRRDYFNCPGCENNCRITRLKFGNGNTFLTGNRCEKIIANRGAKVVRGRNLFEEKRKLLFDRPTRPATGPRLRIGIPRVLNFYENYPFWCTLLVESGMEVVLSPPSTTGLCDAGQGTVVSENICFPAKLAHGHLIDLARKGVDRIFYPMVYRDRQEFEDTASSFNCPIVMSYPDVIRSAIDLETRFGVPFDSPRITFHDEDLLRTGTAEYLAGLGVDSATFELAFAAAQAAQREYQAAVEQAATELLAAARSENRRVIVLAGRPYHLDPLINHKVPEMIAGLGMDVITADCQRWSTEVGEVNALTQYAYPNRLFAVARWVADQPNVELVQLNSFGCGPDALNVDEVAALLKSRGKQQTLLRIDEMTSTGSIKLRLRSLVESLDMRSETRAVGPAATTTRPFEMSDRDKTILVPFFTTFYSFFISSSFSRLGYKVETLPPPDRESVELGLKYVNHDICYPATIVIGDLIKALRSGRYARDEVALGLAQTAGQCRASSYLALLKRGLHSAGYSDIPVVGISLSAGDQNYQPGFKFSKIRLITITIPKIMISDCLARLYYSTAVREKQKGESRRLVERFFQQAETIRGPGSLWRTYRLIRAAVKAFNAVEVRYGDYPPVAIVGEIYVKYNSFGNYGIAEWLTEQGFEVISPPIGEFFAQEGLNLRVNRREGLVAPGRVPAALHRLVYALINAGLHRAARHMRRFKRHRPFYSVDHLASRAERTCSLINQFGEGWLIPGEIAAFAEDGVPNVICAQPFGCIANHIVGRGLEKRLKELYPDLNLLYLDFDSGTSEVNVTNRLHFFARNAREGLRGGGRLESNGHPPTATTNGWQRQTNGQTQELVAEEV